MIFTQSLPSYDFENTLRAASRLDRLSELYKTDEDFAKIPKFLQALAEIIVTKEEMEAEPFRAVLIEGGLPASAEDADATDYLSLLPGEELDTVKKYAQAVFQDLSRIQPRCPIFQKSKRGLGGVTFVEFDDFNFVVKWSGSTEKGASKIYALFLEILGDPLLRVPESEQIFDETALPLRLRSGTSIRPNLLVFPKVPGAPLLDFIKQKYSLLKPTQKNELIRELGKIAMLDALLGNPDRVISTNHWFCSNLDNIMIQCDDDSTIRLFLIDNELNPEKIQTDPEIVADTILQLYTPLTPARPAQTLEEESFQQFASDICSSRALLLEGCNLVLSTLKQKLPERCAEIESLSTELDRDLPDSREFERIALKLKDFFKLPA